MEETYFYIAILNIPITDGDGYVRHQKYNVCVCSTEQEALFIALDLEFNTNVENYKLRGVRFKQFDYVNFDIEVYEAQMKSLSLETSQAIYDKICNVSRTGCLKAGRYASTYYEPYIASVEQMVHKSVAPTKSANMNV